MYKYDLRLKILLLSLFDHWDFIALISGHETGLFWLTLAANHPGLVWYYWSDFCFEIFKDCQRFIAGFISAKTVLKLANEMN